MPTLPTNIRNSLADVVADAHDVSGAGTIEVRTGSTPGAGTLLLTFTLNNPAYGAAGATVAGRADLATGSSISATAVATGTAGHARVKNGAGATVQDLSVGTSGAELNLSTLSVVLGVVYQLTGGTITQPAS